MMLQDHNFIQPLSAAMSASASASTASAPESMTIPSAASPPGLPPPTITHLLRSVLSSAAETAPVCMILGPDSQPWVRETAAMVKQWFKAIGGSVVADAGVDAAYTPIVFLDGTESAARWRPSAGTLPPVLVFLQSVGIEDDDTGTKSTWMHAAEPLLHVKDATMWVTDVPPYMHLQRRYGVPAGRIAVIPSLLMSGLLRH